MSDSLVLLNAADIDARHAALLAKVRTHLQGLEARLSKRIDSEIAPKGALMSARDVATRLGDSMRQFRRMRDAGDIPQPVMVGSRPKWRPEEIEAVLN